MSCAIGLIQDPNTGHWDIGVRGGRLIMDYTPATPMLLALGADRRAQPGDTLPAGETDDSAPIFNARRGWALDPLDTRGRLCGSRVWLLERAKQTDDTRRLAEGYAAESMVGLAQDRDLDIETSAEWIARGRLLLTAAAEGVTASVPVVVT